MPLLDLKTDLKSIKYGHDRPGGGDSNQPYIKTDINTVDENINLIKITNLKNGLIKSKIVSNFDDGLIRGGIIGALNASVVDTIRISKFLTDVPKGPLFIAKQVGLQLSNPRLEVKKASSVGGFFRRIISGDLGFLTGGLLQPTRLYNLGINTLAQIPVNAFGGHFIRHGLLPIQNENSKYEAVVISNNKEEEVKENKNRLLGLATRFELVKSEKGETKVPRKKSKLNNFIRSAAVALTTGKILPANLIIDSYIGGPGSVYGIGSTLIRRTSNFTANKKAENDSYKQSADYAGYTRDEAGKSIDYNIDLSLDVNKASNQIEDRAISNYDFPSDYHIASAVDQTAVKYDFPKSNNPSLRTYAALQKQIANQQSLTNLNNLTSSLSGSNPGYINQFGIYNVTGSNLNGSSNGSYSSKILNDINDINNINNINYKNSYGDVVTVKANSWSDIAREKRVGSGRTDLINLTPLFKDNGGSIKDTLTKLTIPSNPLKNINDLVKFRIQAIETDTPTNSVWMIFRAYITALTDNVDATWTPVKYAGRGDSFYIYDGFSRKMSVSFKVAALSEQEMKPMYQKLNYLMSNLMPDYGAGNVMRGPLVRMTIGNYIDGQLCKLDSLSITVPNESPWEISINDTELILPHIIEVQLGFTPIGSQTQNINYTPQKSDTISNIAQNYNGAADPAGNYITPKSSSIL